MHVPPVARTPRAAARRCAALLLGVLLLPACSAGGAAAPDSGGGLRASSLQEEPPPAPSPASVAPSAPSAAPSVRPLGERRTADVLVVAGAPLSTEVRSRLEALAGPARSVVFRAGTVDVAGRRLPAVGVDPSAFRAFTAAGTAESDAVWAAVARGEAVIGHDAAQRSGLQLGASVEVAPSDDDPSGEGGGDEEPRGEAPADDTSTREAALRLGALATTGLPRADLVVDDATADGLGLPAATAMILSSDGKDPEEFAAEVREAAGDATVDLLSAPAPVARLTGGDAAEDLGSFSYRYYSDGSIEPDAAWVEENIRTESVPIFGNVTCHRLMLPSE